MSYNSKLPKDDEYIAAGPADIRENFRALKEDQIVDAGTLAGLTAGNASGNIPKSNGIVNKNLNADLLDGQEANAFATASHNHSAATTSTAGFMSAVDKTKVDGIATGAQVNQNAFANVTVGTTTIQADSATDTLTLTAGANISLTPDATNDAVTIAVSGTVPSATTATTCSGNAATTTKWATARTLSFTGDATGSMSVDGSAAANAALTLKSTGVTAGTYRSVTVDAQGRVIAGANPTSEAIDITGSAARATTASACLGNSATATKLATARTIALTGAVIGTGTFDGSSNLSIITTSSTTSTTSKQLFTSSSTFTVPNGVTFVKVTCVGGAGGGGGSNNSGTAGSGATGWVNSSVVSVTPGQVITVTVGAGGAGGKNRNSNNTGTSTAGSTGGTSSFGSLLSAPGGGGAPTGGLNDVTNAYTYSHNSRRGIFYSYSIGGAGGNAFSGPVLAAAGTSGIVMVEW